MGLNFISRSWIWSCAYRCIREGGIYTICKGKNHTVLWKRLSKIFNLKMWAQEQPRKWELQPTAVPINCRENSDISSSKSSLNLSPSLELTHTLTMTESSQDIAGPDSSRSNGQNVGFYDSQFNVQSVKDRYILLIFLWFRWYRVVPLKGQQWISTNGHDEHTSYGCMVKCEKCIW